MKSGKWIERVMGELKRLQKNPRQDWQKADARVLGQILASQNIVFALPDTTRIAEFYAQALISIPGISACRVCLGGKPVQAGEMETRICAECESGSQLAWQDGVLIPANKCNLAVRPDMRLIPINSYRHHFGFFIIQVKQTDVAEVYQAFIDNLSNYVALILENRWQKDLLQKAHDELERKVVERTHDLIAANEALAASNRAALHMMQEAVEARKRAEQVNTDLQHEVAERKRTEEELSTYREHLEELVRERTAELEAATNKAQQYLDIAGVILVAIDRDCRVSLINQKGCDVLGIPSSDIIGKHWFETFVPKNVRQKVLQGFGKLMAGEIEQVEYLENPVLTQGGQERLIAWHNVLLRDGEGNITGTLSSGEDITQQKRAEKYITSLNRDLQKRAAALEAANKELDAFAYSVSHDLRAPLRHIDGFLELLQKKAGTALDEKSRHYMDSISGAAKKMGRLIDDLLAFSRLGRRAMLLKQMDLGNLVREVIREFEPDVAGRDIKWSIGDFPAVHGDVSMLRIVMGNLITNALKFTRPRRQAHIEIGSIPGQGYEAVIFVRDNGVGFEKTYVDKIFGVFQRLHSTDEFEGTGVGLAIVQRIINRHGGRTWAEGNLGLGATVYFSLALHDKEKSTIGHDFAGT